MYRRRARVVRRTARVSGTQRTAPRASGRDEEQFVVSSASMMKQVKTHPNHQGLASYNMSFTNTLTAPANDLSARTTGSNNVSVILLNGISQGSGQHQRSPSSSFIRMRSLYIKAGIYPMAMGIQSTTVTEINMTAFVGPQFLSWFVVYDKRPTTPPTFPTYADFYEQTGEPLSHLPVNNRGRFDILYRKTMSWRGHGWFSEAGFATAWGSRPRTLLTEPSMTPLIDVRVPINRDAAYVSTPTPSADAQSVTELVSGHLYLVCVGSYAFSAGVNVRFYSFPRLSFVDL